jgi:hypothetical protein
MHNCLRRTLTVTFRAVQKRIFWRSIEESNAGRFDTVAALLKDIRKPEAPVANKTMVEL